MIEVEDEPTCEDCFGEFYEECYDCQDIITQDESYYSESSREAFCIDCYYERYTRCESCDYEMNSDETNYSESDGCNYCDDCYENDTDVDLDSYGL